MSAKILIIDDQPSARQTLENQLFSEGYTLRFATNAAEGLSQAQVWQPDVILSDVMMPGMDGFELCRQIRADVDLGQIPIILITALNDRQAKLEGLQAGADDFISKPIDTLELRARLRTLTRLDRFRKLNAEHLQLEAAHRDLLQAHEALRVSELRFRNLIETSSDAIFVVDLETGQFVLANPAASQLYGYSQPEFLQMFSADVSAEPQKTTVAIQDGVSFVPERLHRRKDGSTFPVEISGSYFLESGRPFHTAFIRDISTRQQAEAQIQRRNRELKALQATILDLASSQSLSELLNLIVERACDLLETSSGALYLSEPDQQIVRCVVSYRTPHDYTGTTLKLGEGAAGWVVQTGEALLIEDYRLWSGRAAQFEVEQPFERVMSVPLKWEAQVIGVIHALRVGHQPFIQADLELLGLFANHASLAVAQARLREALEHELHEQRRLEAALRESEARAQAMLNAFPDMMFRLNRAGVILDYRINLPALGELPGHLLGQPLQEVLPPELAHRAETCIAAALEAGQLQSFEASLTEPGAVRRDFDARLVPAGAEEVLAIVRDITERKQAETRLRESEERFRSFIEQSTDGFMLSDEQGRIIAWNSTLTHLTGISAEEALGLSTWEVQFQLLSPEKRALFSLEQLHQVTLSFLQNSQSALFRHPAEAEIQTRSGEMKFIQQTSFPIETSQGHHLGGVIRDITEFKAIELKLRENEEKYHSLVSHAVEAITLTDEAGLLIEWNEAAERVTGIPAREALGKPVWEVHLRMLPPEQRTPARAEKIARKIQEVLQTGQASRLENLMIRLMHPSGKWYFLDQAVFAIPTAHGFRLCTLTHDITAAKEAEMALQAAHSDLECTVRERTADLEAANLALEKALHAKDEFLAAVSHELRTPLTGVLGMVELLRMPHSGTLNEKQLKSVAIIEKSGRRLLETVNNVLDFSLLQGGQASVRLENCSLETLWRSVQLEIEPLAHKKRQRFHAYSLPEQVTVVTDERHLQKILLLLLNNASKFTPEAGEFGLEIIDSAENVKLVIWDHGIGIREADFPRLFQPFAQLDAGLARQYEGSGLGLVLAQQMTHLIGGKIEVASRLGAGSRFTITLPHRVGG